MSLEPIGKGDPPVLSRSLTLWMLLCDSTEPFDCTPTKHVVIDFRIGEIIKLSG